MPASEEKGVSAEEQLSNEQAVSKKEEISKDGNIVEKREESEDEETSEDEERSIDPWHYTVEYGVIHGFYEKDSKVQKFTVPLKEINIKTHVNGSEAEVRVEQRYLNPKRRTLRDVSFYYAVGEKEKIVECQVNVDGKIFKDAVRAVEEESTEMRNIDGTMIPMKDRLKGKMVSRIEIGKLKRKAEVISTIKYVTEACYEESQSTHLIIPTTLVPDRQPPDPFQVNNWFIDNNYNPYIEVPMEIEITGLVERKVKYISCSSHDINLMEQNFSDGTITMTTSLPGTDPTEIENDFVVDIDWMSPNERKETLTSLRGTFEAKYIFDLHWSLVLTSILYVEPSSLEHRAFKPCISSLEPSSLKP